MAGIIASYDRDACDAPHWEVYPNTWKNTDECRMFRYSTGWRAEMSDHWNMRIFAEWCQEHRSGLFERLKRLKAFW